MKKINKKSSPEITSEAKSEIQELFDELFVGNLSSEITKVISQSNESFQEIGNVKKLSKSNFSVLADKLECIQESLQCLGDKDEWNDETIISFLNTLAKLISECISMVDKRTGCLDSEWKEGVLESYLVNVELLGNSILNKVESIETIGTDFEKLYNEIKKIDGIIGKLSILERGLNNILSYFDCDGVVENISSTQTDIKDRIYQISNDIKTIECCIENKCSDLEDRFVGIDNKLEVIDGKIHEINQIIDENVNAIENRYNVIEKKAEVHIKYLFSGIAISIVLNIAILIMMIIK